MSNFASKVVLITGSSSGIGAEAARSFAKQGACLTITGRKEEKLAKVYQECIDLGAKEVLQIVADFEKRENIDKVIEETINKFGKLDVLINNAGNLIVCTIDTFKEEYFDSMMDVNVKVAMLLSQRAIPHLEKTQGNIVNISGISSSSNAIAGIMLCAMAKSSLDKFTKLLAVEVAGRNIRVNAVNPSLVLETSIFDDCGFTDETRKQFFEAQKITHILGSKNIEPNEVVSAILFLASDAAKAITGTILNVDRGRVITGQ